MRPVPVKAKHHTVILQPIGAMAKDVIFTVETGDGSPPSGKVEERRKALFGFKSTMHDLRAEHRFRIGSLTNGFRLALIPDQDVVVYFQTSHTQFKDVLKVCAIVFVGMFALTQILRLLGGGVS